MLHVIPSLINTPNRETIVGQDYFIYTDDPKYVGSFESFDELRKICTVTFRNLNGNSREVRMLNAFKDTIAYAHTHHLMVGLIAPDNIYSPNAFKNMMKKMKEGFDCCILPMGGLRVNRNFINEYTPVLDDFEFTKLYMKHIHLEMMQHYVESDNFPPTAIMRIEQLENILYVKSFYHQPIYFKVNAINEFDNLELNMLDKTGCRNVYCVKDSTEFMMASVTDSVKYNSWERKYNEDEFIEYNSSQINPVSFISFYYGFKIHENKLCLQNV